MRGRLWLAVCVVHAVASMLVWWQGDALAQWLTWRASDGWSRPWTWWTSAWVHRSTPHLVGNQLAIGALAAVAWVLRPDHRVVLAWLLAWPLVPLTQVWWPFVGYYVGLSGLIHAALAALVVGVWLNAPAHGLERRWGWLLGVGLVAKLVFEQGWTRPVVWSDSLGLSVVQSAHLTGALAGALWSAVLSTRWWQAHRPPVR